MALSAMTCEACGEARLTVTVGQAVLVSKSEGSWAHGRGPQDSSTYMCNAAYSLQAYSFYLCQNCQGLDLLYVCDEHFPNMISKRIAFEYMGQLSTNIHTEF